MQNPKTAIVPVLLVTVGTGWLLTTLGIAPEINWVWTLGLAICGVATFIACGFDKFSFVVGSLFAVTSLTSVLRQSGQLAFDHEVPILVIVSGLLLFFARLKAVPAVTWMQQGPPEEFELAGGESKSNAAA